MGSTERRIGSGMARGSRRFAVLGGLLMVMFASGCQKGDLHDGVSPSDNAQKNESQDSASRQEGRQGHSEQDVLLSKTSRGYALLVACTRYRHLPVRFQLRGPANDVVLMRQLLIDRFGFSGDNIATLAEEQEDQRQRPTRANIVREFLRLIERVGEGDQVVILLAGHGSQQPDDDPENLNDSEPDGLDELFLPCDVRPRSAAQTVVENTIVDDEIREWLARMTGRGASVWFLADSCHSGTLARGVAEDEQPREVPASLLVPQPAIERAIAKADSIYGTEQGTDRRERVDLPDDRGALVAIYASQPDEPTFERRLPMGVPDSKPYGLLTFAVNQVLRRVSQSVTYRELGQLLHQQYCEWGRSYPTPLVEGSGLNRHVLNDERQSVSRVLLSRNASGERVIDAGILHGVHAGGILRVLPPAGQENADVLLGHVRVIQERTLDSIVEPVAYGGLPAADELPLHSRCEMALHTYGDLRLSVGVEKAELLGGKLPAEQYRELAEVVESLQEGKHSLTRFVESAAEADWRVALHDGHVYLLPPGGFLLRNGEWANLQTSLYGPAPNDETLPGWLETRLERIARVRNLTILAGGAAAVATAFDVQLELLRYESTGDRTPRVITWNNDLALQKGDIVQFRVKNTGATPVDVTLLFIDENYGITPLLPRSSFHAGVRVAPQKSIVSGRSRITAAAGHERVALIAVRPKEQQEVINFAWLAQPSLELAMQSRGSDASPPSPLEELLRTSLFAAGPTRGRDVTEVYDFTIRMMSWRGVGGPDSQKPKPTP